MKGFLNALGWIFFLLLALIGLLFYNFTYLPKKAKITRLQQEIVMWTERVSELTDSLKRTTERSDTLFTQTFRFDEIFENPESLVVSRQGEALLREILPRLQNVSGVVEVIGHTDSKRSPSLTRWPTGWEYSASAASTVARSLISLGLPQKRVRVVAAADTKPLIAQTGMEAQVMNRRIEIVLRIR